MNLPHKQEVVVETGFADSISDVQSVPSSTDLPVSLYTHTHTHTHADTQLHVGKLLVCS